MAKTLFTETVLVLTATRYSVDGNEGTSLQYISSDYAETNNRRGSAPVDASATVGLFDDLTVLPGIYEMHFGRGNGVRNGSGKNKATTEPIGATLIDELDLETLLELEPAKS